LLCRPFIVIAELYLKGICVAVIARHYAWFSLYDSHFRANPFSICG
jgi:vancomycin permeability regulator SanA